MEPAWWQSRWDAGQTGFHEGHPNANLVRWWPTLGLPPDATVLVPLCGKSADLRWLAEQGHPVTGVEVSPVAVDAFFREQGWTPSVRQEAGFRVVSAGGVSIWEGDWWSFPRTRYAAIYDRASIIALPPELRAAHGDALRQHLGGMGLMVTLNHGSPGGPPFAVPAEEVRATLGWADLELLESKVLADEPGRAPGRVEQIWRLGSHR